MECKCSCGRRAAGGMEGGGCTIRGGNCTGRDTLVASLALLTLYLTLGGGKGLAKYKLVLPHVVN